MKELKIRIIEPLGLHARPAGLLARECMQLQSSIKIKCRDFVCDGKSVFGIMGLMACENDEICISIEGSDEVDSDKRLRVFFTEKNIGQII